MFPFTPVTGPRLFSASAETRALLAKGLVSVCRELKTSSAHITFLPEADWAPADKAHWIQRQDIQFHCHNQGYKSFDDFLATLSSSKGKNIRKERKTVLEAGISFHWVTGKDLRESHWDAFFDFYMETGSRKWGAPYLTRKFFSLISKSMGPHVLLILARREGRIIAGALNFIGSEALYGRNWGASEHHDFLHFETCYYQAIDFCFYDHSILELSGKTMGIFGYGNIGRRVGKVAHAFGMKIIATVTNKNKEKPDYVTFVDEEAIFRDSDFLSLHCPLTDATSGIINKSNLLRMKNKAILINTARGKLIEERDLFYALDHGLIAGAILDVLTHEPPSITNPLLKHSRSLITPHIGWAGQQSRKKLIEGIASNITAYCSGQWLNRIS